MSNLALYRLGVVLRWHELDSCRAKDKPLKIHLQKLRRVRSWPVHELYETPQVFPVDAEPDEDPRAFVNRHSSVCGALRDIGRNLSDGDVEVFLVRRKDGKDYVKPDLRFCDIESEGGNVVYEAPDVEPHHIPKKAQRPSPPPGSPAYEGDTSAPSWHRQFYKEARPSRTAKREAENNQHIDAKLEKLREKRDYLKSQIDRTSDEARKRRLRFDVTNLTSGIKKLVSQRSSTDHAGEFVGGYNVPPPHTCVIERCGRCHTCPRADGRVVRTACLRCSRIKEQEQRGTAAPLRAGHRINRRDGRLVYTCPGCRNDLPSLGSCCDAMGCLNRGKVLHFPDFDAPRRRGERVKYRWVPPPRT